MIAPNKYAFGITLEELQIYTANQKWEKQFIDRTDKKMQLEALRKRLHLQSLGIYWDSNTEIILSDLPPEKVTLMMKHLVLKSDDKLSSSSLSYLITITASCRLTQKNLRDPETKENPNLMMEIFLKPLNINLERVQLEDMIRLLEFASAFNHFKKEFKAKRAEEIKNSSEENKKQNIQLFKALFEKMQRHEKKDDYKGEEKIKQTLANSNDVKEFKYLIQAIPDEDLALAVKDVIKTVELERQKKEIEEKKANKGRFNLFGSKSKGVASITHEEMAELENFLDKTLEQDAFEDTSEQFASQKNFVINFLLEGGTISLFNQTPDFTVEGIAFEYEELKAEIEMRNKGQRIQTSLKDVSLMLKTQYPGTTDFVTTPIMQKLSYSKDQSKPFFLLVFETDPKGKEDGIYLNVEWQSLEFIYRPVAIQRLTTFFDVSTNDESLRLATKEKLHEAQDFAAAEAKGALKARYQSKVNISVRLASPTLIVPFIQNGDLMNPCWAMQFGDLSVDSVDPKEETHCNIYDVSLIGTNLKYFPSQLLYNKTKELVKDSQQEEDFKGVFDVLEDVSISVELKMLKPYDESQEPKNDPQISLNMSISGIHVRLNPQIYNYLLRTREFVSVSQQSQVEFQENDREVLMLGTEKAGYLYHREKKFNDTVWSLYFVILKGGYLYFFRDINDNRPAFTVYIKDGKISAVTDESKKAAFTVKLFYYIIR